MNSRHKLRELAMTSLYQHFLLQKDIKECVYDNSETNEIDPFLYTVTIDAIRLGFVEQAILMMAACELDLETAPKAIVIDEAVTLAKKYCDDETYRLINGVLDRL